jgi:Protein of unknown function (DUF2793)
MSRTAQLGLPLLTPSQAQKHVTVNEALLRLDAAVHLRVRSAAVVSPPESAADGDSYIIPPGSTGVWVGCAGQVATWSNGGWIFLQPSAGLVAWDIATSGTRRFDGADWLANAVSATAGGAATISRILEFDHQIVAGASNVTTLQIPAFAQVLGVSARVIEAITGAQVTGWKVGVGGSPDRYGSGIGKSKNSSLIGLSSSPISYYYDTPLLLSSEGGAFSGGKIRIAIHTTELKPPRSV